MPIMIHLYGISFKEELALVTGPQYYSMRDLTWIEFEIIDIINMKYRGIIAILSILRRDTTIKSHHL